MTDETLDREAQSDLERKTLVLRVFFKYTDRWVVEIEFIRNAVEWELGCIELLEYEE